MKKVFLLVVFFCFNSFKVSAEETSGWKKVDIAPEIPVVDSVASQKKAEEAVADTQSATDVLREKIAALNASIRELSDKKGGLKSNIDELQEQSSALESKVKELQSAVDALRIERENREKEVALLQVKQKELQEEFDSLLLKWQAISNRKNVTEYLKTHSHVVWVCSESSLNFSKPTGRNGEFRTPCDIQLNYVGSPSAYFKPSRFTITHQNSSMTVFEKTLSSNQDEEVIHPAEWYNSEKIVTGKKYEMWVEYKGNGEVSDVSYKLLTFTMTKKPFVFQIVPKLYTAWRHGEDEDVTMILPGVGVGGAYRYGDRSDDRNVIGLRGVFAFGPNLTSNNKRLQLVAGAEVVLSRYLSAGVAWVAYGPDREGVPMILLSYGDLYPAVVNTK